jgi:ribosomal protein S6E (S10)
MRRTDASGVPPRRRQISSRRAQALYLSRDTPVPPVDGQRRRSHRARVKILVALSLAWVCSSCRSHGDPRQAARTAVGEIAAAAERYRKEHGGACPRQLGDLVDGKQLAKAPKDPWGGEYVLTCPGNYDLKGGTDVVSPGPDHELGTRDDVNSWD